MFRLKLWHYPKHLTGTTDKSIQSVQLASDRSWKLEFPEYDRVAKILFFNEVYTKILDRCDLCQVCL